MTTTEAQTLLDLIESVDENDTDTLDEIDARATLWIKEWCGDYVKNYEAPGYQEEPYGTRYVEDTKGYMIVVSKFTRSRDALKGVRPFEYWLLSFRRTPDGKVRCVLTSVDKNVFSTMYLMSEELAELHAIIQAIEWERQQK